MVSVVPQDLFAELVIGKLYFRGHQVLSPVKVYLSSDDESNHVLVYKHLPLTRYIMIYTSPFLAILTHNKASFVKEEFGECHFRAHHSFSRMKVVYHMINFMINFTA